MPKLKSIINLLVCYLLLPSIVGVVVYQWTKPRAKLEVLYAFIDTKPYRKDALGSLHLYYKQDEKMDRFEMSVQSIGSDAARDVDIDLRSMKPNLFGSPETIFDPATIENRVRNKTISSNQIYYGLSELPQDCGVTIILDGMNYFGEEDINIGVIGSGRRWWPVKKEIVLKKSKRSVLKKLLGKLNLQVCYGRTAEEHSTSKQDTKQDTKKDTPKSRILFGGYDPVVLTNGVFTLLQHKKIISSKEAKHIKKVAMEPGPGVRISGINVLKFDEVLLNTLIKKKTINKSQAQLILKRSQNAGGILINGYNVVHLNAEILNTLSEKGLLSLSEAQITLDSAKTP